MSRHLSPEESIAALERTLDPSRRLHVDACERCRRELADLESVWSGARAASDDAEPSPLFWDQFSARVREAVRAESSAGAFEWRRLWQPAGAIAAAAVLLLWLAGRDPARPEPAAIDQLATASDGVSPDPRWDAVMELAAELSVGDVHRAVPSRFESVVLFDELTDEEQAALADLLASEMRGLE
jgi:hypothetical protein